MSEKKPNQEAKPTPAEQADEADAKAQAEPQREPAPAESAPRKKRGKKGAMLRFLKGCAVRGEAFGEGEKARVPDEISEEDARQLVRMGRAEMIGGEK